MRLFLFGSYTVGNERKDSDIDVFITDDKLCGYIGENGSEDIKEIHTITEDLEPLSVEYNGYLDLFLDRGDFFQSIYNPERSLFGKTFLINLENDIHKNSREITLNELYLLLEAPTYEQRLSILSHILERSTFIR